MNELEVESVGSKSKRRSTEGQTFTCKLELSKIIIVLSVVTVFTTVLSIISLLVLVQIKSDLKDVYDAVYTLEKDLLKHQGKSSSVPGETSSTSKQKRSQSFIIRGFDSSEGFNITVDFPDNSMTTGGSASKLLQLQCNKTLTHLENLLENLKVGQGTNGCGPNNLGDTILKAIQQLQAPITNIKATQEVILLKINQSSASSSSTTPSRRLEESLLSLQNGVGKLETIALESKSVTNHLQTSMQNILQDSSKVKLDTSSIIIDVGTMKSRIDNLLGRSTCVDDISPFLINLQKKIQDVENKTEKMRQGVMSLTEGGQSISAIAQSVSDKITLLDTSTVGMKDKCVASETKLTEVLAKVGLPTDPPTASFAQVTISFCSRQNDCRGVQIPTTHCYKAVASPKKSWYGAREACSLLGGYLAEVDSELESREIASLLDREGEYWIGGTDAGFNGRWQWNYSGRSISMTAWKPNQPSSSLNDCMSLSKDGWSWKADSCTYVNGYVCEKEANDCKDWME